MFSKQRLNTSSQEKQINFDLDKEQDISFYSPKSSFFSRDHNFPKAEQIEQLRRDNVNKQHNQAKLRKQKEEFEKALLLADEIINRDLLNSDVPKLTS